MYRRAPFIWTAKQPIDAAGAFRVFFETPARRDDGTNRWFLFRRRFQLPGPADEAQVTLTVDGRYQLFANGARVGRGPVRCDPLYQRTDTYDLRTHVRSGENVIALLVHVYGIDTAWYQAVHGHWQPAFGDGGVYCDGRARCGARVIDLLSDEQWRCLECDAWERDTPRANWGLGFIEVYDARRMPERWTEPDFDDSAWDEVQVLSVGGGAPDSMLGGLKIEPFPTLLPRAIPFLAESLLAPVRVVASYAVVPNAELPVDRRLYEEALQPLPDEAVGNPDALLRADEGVATVRTSDGRDVSLLLDAERGVYVDMVDPATNSRSRRVSQHANTALILWDIAPRERWASMIKWITDPARLVFTAAPPVVPSGGGFDPENNVVLANTFFSHFVYRALCRASRFDLALGLMRERFGRMLARGATTLWESYDPTASLCHGFSATPVYQLSTAVLGVYPTAPGFTHFHVRPHLGDLQSARGLFPTVKGDIEVEWTRGTDCVDIEVAVPDETQAEAMAPLGYVGGHTISRLNPGRHVLRFHVREKSD
jgi:hypothetical protein